MKTKLILLISIVFLSYSCDSFLDGDPLISGDYDYTTGGMGDPTGNGDGEYEAGQITAGEWNDLENWDFFKNILNENEYYGMQSYWEFYTNNKFYIQLNNTSESPIVNAKLELVNVSGDVLWTSRTDNLGMSVLWSGITDSISSLNPDEVFLKVNDTQLNSFDQFTLDTNDMYHVVANIDGLSNSKIDIAFVVDATGSMGDEIEYLKAELLDVIERVAADNPSTTINLASLFYRDQGDDYLTKKAEFTTNIDDIIDFIDDQSAGGGGDYPEAVHTALRETLNDLQWSTNADSRLLFFILDAPPHYEDQIIDDIHSSIETAAEMGVKIIPVTASGIDKETEFLMRFMSIATNGTYVFITGDSGIGNEHLEPTVGQYEVEYLNDLLVRLINKYADQ